MKNPKSFRLRLTLSLLSLVSLLSPAKSRCRLSGLLCSLPLLLFPSTLVHAQWEPERRLTFNDSLSALPLNYARVIEANPSGIVHVVWWDNRDGNREIYYKRSSDSGDHWASDRRLTYASGSSDNPSLALTGSYVFMVWDDSRGVNWNIYFKNSTDSGMNWGSDDSLSNGLDPSIAASNGKLHLIWRDYRNGNYEIYYKRSTDLGISWSSDTRLTFDTSESGLGSVSAADSVVHVIWRDHRDGNYEIYYKRSSDEGLTWFPDVRLTCDSSNSWTASSSVTGNNVHLVWDDDRDGYRKIYYKRSTDEGINWSSDLRLTDDTSGAYFPSVYSSGSNVHVVWEDARDGGFWNHEIYYNASTDKGLTWSPEIRLTTDSGYSERPCITAVDSMLHVVWVDHRDWYTGEIYYKRNPTGNSGVEVSSPISLSPCPLVPLSVVPNPFSSFTALPGHASERFVLYDISGRRVGTYKGDRIGEGLSAGVYFLRPEGRDAKPLRIVKLR